MPEISYEEASRVLAYETGTGFLIRKINTGRMHKAGVIVGSADFRGISVTIGKKRYKAHRIAWLLFYKTWPTMIIDHIDGDPTNNKIENLRQATSSQNSRNARIGKANKTDCIGVVYNKKDRTHRALINNNAGEQIYLGSGSIEKCTRLRKAAEKEYGYHENHGRRKRNAS